MFGSFACVVRASGQKLLRRWLLGTVRLVYVCRGGWRSLEDLGFLEVLFRVNKTRGTERDSANAASGMRSLELDAEPGLEGGAEAYWTAESFVMAGN